MLCKHGHARGVAEGGDYIAVTSQTHRSPDGLFKGIFSEHGLFAFLRGLSVLRHSQFYIAPSNAL